METIARRPRFKRTEGYARLTPRAKALLLILNPLICKFLTTSQILFLWDCDDPWKADGAKRALRKLYDAGFLDRPIQQRNTPNAGYKDLVYERTDKGARAVNDLGLTAHRSNSYPHELITDFCFSFPYLYWAKLDPDFSYTITPLLMYGEPIETTQGIKQIPHSTREHHDPFDLKGVRGDYTPVVFHYKKNIVFIPFVQTDRNTENLTITKRTKDQKRTVLTGHIDDIMRLHREGFFEKHYGFKEVLVPILCANRTHLDNAKAYVRSKYGNSRLILFKYVPDIAYLDHFPAIDSIDPLYERVGHPDFNLKTLEAVK